jgi:hypothetical protein
MTPLLPTPDDYLYNLIVMTSPEAKRLWRRSIKEHFDHTCIYACTSCNQDKGSTPVLSWMRDKFGVNRLREKLIMEYIT